VFWLLPTDTRAASVDAAYVSFTRPAAEAMRSQHVRRVVDVSALGRDTAYASRAGQQAIPLLGPEDLCGNDLAAVISDVLGSPVLFKQIPVQAFSDQLTGYGMSPAMTRSLLDMLIAKDNGLDNGIARTPLNAIDTPTTFRQWCEYSLKPAAQAA
jgi:hypothetical protein